MAHILACRSSLQPFWEPLAIPDHSAQTSIPPYQFIYGKFEYDAETGDARSDLKEVFRTWPVTRLLRADEASVASPLLRGSAGGTSRMDNMPFTKEVDCLFRGVDRIKLICSIMSNHRYLTQVLSE